MKNNKSRACQISIPHWYTAVAHAEANDHFKLMDRLKELGGKGHGLQKEEKETTVPLGTVKVKIWVSRLLISHLKSC